jgi:hypothetical protein
MMTPTKKSPTIQAAPPARPVAAGPAPSPSLRALFQRAAHDRSRDTAIAQRDARGGGFMFYLDNRSRIPSALFVLLSVYLTGKLLLPAAATGIVAMKEALGSPAPSAPALTTPATGPSPCVAPTTAPTQPEPAGEHEPELPENEAPAKATCPPVPPASSAWITVIAPDKGVISAVHGEWRCDLPPGARVVVPAGALLLRLSRPGQGAIQRTVVLEKGTETALELGSAGR